VALPLTHRALIRVLAVAWLCTGQAFWWPGPVPLWQPLFAMASFTLCVVLLVTPFARAAALALAAMVGLELLVTPTFFAHNRLFVAALLVTVGLSTSTFTWLPRAQVALVYGLAAVDKLLSEAWRDGRFVESFLAQLARFGLMWSPSGTVGEPNPLAQWLVAHGSPGLWQAAGWATIVLELGLAACFGFGWRWGVWLGLGFHVGVYALTGSPMGQFFFAGAAASLLLLRDDQVPPVGGLMLLTALFSGPWGHRAFPVAALGLLIFARLREVSLRGAGPSR
jgi:hypothetical protein